VPGTGPLPSWALEESAEELYEDAPCGYLSTAADGTVVRANRTLLRWLGLERDVVVGRRRLADLLAPGPRVVWLTHHVPQLAANGQVGGVLLDLVASDGAPVPVMVEARLVQAAGLAPVVRVTLTDARERRAYESSLRAARAAAEQAEQRARALQRVTHACAASTTPAELVHAVVEAAADAYRLPGCALLLEEAGGHLHMAAVFGSEPPGTGLPPEGGRADGEVLVRQLGGEELATTGWAGGAVAYVPVQHAGRQLGVLTLLLPAAGALASDDRSVLRSIGELAGMALTRTRFYEKLQRLALHDELTGLANRGSLSEVLAQALAHADRTHQPLAVMLVDLDGFKQVNDTLGHAAGDAVLVACAERLRETVRESDRLARLGGDEFVVVAEETDQGAAEVLASRIAARLAEPVDVGPALAQVSASVGLVVRPPGSGSDAAGLLAQADAAMYDEKRRHRSPTT
jgi:diguanylate cyclase (GGDEF)-like protein